MRVLLIEDENSHCEEYEKCAEFLPYSVELDVSNGMDMAIKLIVDGDYDVGLLDLELNESDGDGVNFLQWLRAAKLKQTPFIIVITNNRSRVTHNIVRNLGADYIFLKMKPDYSPRLVFDFAQNCMKSKPQEEQRDESLQAKIYREVEKIGFTRDVSGTDYIICAVETVLHSGKNSVSLSKDIYPVIAKKFKKTDWGVARAIRTAIMRTWRMTDVETLQENYTSNVDYDTGIPTNKQVILYIADKIKMVGAECV